MNIKHLNVKVLTLMSSLAYHHAVRNKDFSGINELRLHGASWLEYCSFSGTSILLDVTPTIKDRLRQRREKGTLPAMTMEGMLHSMWSPNVRNLDGRTWYEAKLGTFYSPSLTKVKIRRPENFGSLNSYFTQELDYSYLTENDNIYWSWN